MRAQWPAARGRPRAIMSFGGNHKREKQYVVSPSGMYRIPRLALLRKDIIALLHLAERGLAPIGHFLALLHLAERGLAPIGHFCTWPKGA